MAQATFGEVSQSRKNNFDIIRLVLATLVLFSHSFPLAMGNDHAEPCVIATSGQVAFGTLAVDAFFAISGFLITQSWLRSKKPSDYLRKRVLRIYPGFIVAILFCVFVVGPLTAPNATEYLRSLHPRSMTLAVLTCVAPPMPRIFARNPFPNAVNGSLWTIRYELWCYILVAMLGLCGLLRRRGWVLVLFVAVLGLHIAQEIHIQWHDVKLADLHNGLFHGKEILCIGSLDNWPRLLVYFLAGSVFFLYCDHIPRSRGLLALACVALLLCMRYGLNATLPIFGVYILFYMAFITGESEGGIITRYGDFSYGVYLYAFVVQQTLLFWLGSCLNPWTLTLAAFPITFLFAYLSWNFVEKPFLGRARRARTQSQ